MKPYYEDEYVTLYFGRWQDVLPTLAMPLAVVTDQPYGTGWVRNDGAKQGQFVANRATAAGMAEHEAWDVWDMSWVAAVPDLRAFAVMGPWSRRDDLRASLPQPNALVWWRKTNPRPNGPDREPLCVGPMTLPEGIEHAAYNGDTPFHPNKKPLSLMTWALGFVASPLVVCDPFCGSGSTLVAAKGLGRRAIGIEMREHVCATAASRLSQNVLDFGASA